MDRVSRRRRRRSRFVYRAERLIVETDGRDAHTARRRLRPTAYAISDSCWLGWRVVRLPWQQVIFEPADVAATLRGLLG